MPGTIDHHNIYDLIERFEETHCSEYRFKLPNNPVEIVNFHIVGVAKVEKLSLQAKKNEVLWTQNLLISRLLHYLSFAQLHSTY